MSKKDLGLTLLSDRVLILPEEKVTEKSVAGIILPTAKDNERGLEKGVVVAIGAGRRKEDGSLISLTVKVGDHVYFKRGYDAEELELNDVKYILGSEGNIYAIIG